MNNSIFPTEAEFVKAKDNFRTVMADIMDVHYRPKNPKVDEVVARTLFGIQNGYQTLAAHWASNSLDGVELSDWYKGRETVTVMVDCEGGLWLYHGEIIAEKRGINFRDGGYAINSVEDFHELEEEGLILGELDSNDVKILRKFFKLEEVCVDYSESKHGLGNDWAGYTYAQAEIESYGFIEKGQVIDHMTANAGCDATVLVFKANEAPEGSQGAVGELFEGVNGDGSEARPFGLSDAKDRYDDNPDFTPYMVEIGISLDSDAEPAETYCVLVVEASEEGALEDARETIENCISTDGPAFYMPMGMPTKVNLSDY